MKPDDSPESRQKSARRSLGSRALIGRVPRIGLAHTGTRGRLKEFRETQEFSQRLGKRMVIAWSLSLVVLAVMVLCGIFGYWIVRRPSTAPPTIPPVTEELAVENDPQDDSPNGTPVEAEALLRVKESLAIRTPERVSEHFIPGGNTSDQIVAFLKSLPTVDGEIRYRWLGNMDANGLKIEAVAVHWDAGETQYRRLALLTPDEEGSWKVDFDALAETSTPGWDEWQKPGPLEGIMRIGFLGDMYYNGRYHDDSVWACYTVYGADADLSFFAYCKRGSDPHRALEEIMANHENSLPFIKKQIHAPRAVIAVSRRADSDRRQLEITRVIAEGLIVGPTPFEETLRKF